MSMRNSGASGLVVALFDLRNVIGDENMEKVIEATDNLGAEEITAMVNSFIPKGFPSVESVFVLGDEDESDDLEQHVWYATFEDSELYIRTKTPALHALESVGVNPELRRWVVWG
jgi:hypothetical protein